MPDTCLPVDLVLQSISAPGLIFIVIALLLTHFFDDSDTHRSICEEIRSKYICVNRSPQEFINDPNPNFRKNKEAEVFKDYISLRAIKIHFGAITTIIVSGLSVLMLITGNLAYNFYEMTQYFWTIAFVITGIFIGCVQLVFIEQQKGTVRRIKDFKKNHFPYKGNFEQQCKSICGEEVEEIRSHFYSFSKMWFDFLEYPTLGVFVIINIPIIFRALYKLATLSQ